MTKEQAVERLAVMLMNGMPQTMIDNLPSEDDLQRSLMDSQAAMWKANSGYARERWDIQTASARRVLTMLGLVAVDPALVERVREARPYVDLENNTRRNRMLVHGGRTMSAAEWARDVGLDSRVLHRRLRVDRGDAAAYDAARLALADAVLEQLGGAQ